MVGNRERGPSFLGFPFSKGCYQSQLLCEGHCLENSWVTSPTSKVAKGVYVGSAAVGQHCERCRALHVIGWGHMQQLLLRDLANIAGESNHLARWYWPKAPRALFYVIFPSDLFKALSSKSTGMTGHICGSLEYHQFNWWDPPVRWRFTLYTSGSIATHSVSGHRPKFHSIPRAKFSVRLINSWNKNRD